MEKTYIRTDDAIGAAGRLLDEHDEEIEITEKVFSTIQDIYKQLLEAANEPEAYVLGTLKNVEALSACYDEPMSPSAREEFLILYESACIIHNEW